MKTEGTLAQVLAGEADWTVVEGDNAQALLENVRLAQ